MASQDEEVISKDFLENVLGEKVESFSVNLRPDTGDNYLSIIYNIDVTLISDDKKTDKNLNRLHLLAKCYPSNQGRQDFLNSTGIFCKELAFYKVWVPALHKFVEELDLKEEIKLNFPTFIDGNSTNYENDSGNGEKNTGQVKITGPFENYVMMVDCCKTDGFKLADRHVRLDKDHLVLAVEAMAKIHALSWAYKNHKKIDVYKEKFPLSLVFDYEAGRSTFETVTASNLDETEKSLKSNPEITSQMLAGFVNFRQHSYKVLEVLFGESTEPENEIEKYFRVRPAEVPGSTEIPWRVVIHGDFQMTNLLFRYNLDTNKPEEVVLLDLQLSREASPLIDLAYFMYTSTFLETRQKHCDEILELYHEKFNYFCQIFKTETLPGFTLNELKRRYQRSKIYGFLIAIFSGAFMLKDKDNVVQMDSLEGMSQEEIFNSVSKGISTNVLYCKTMGSLIKEIYNEGII